MVRGTIFSVKRGKRDQELVRGTNSPANAIARLRGGCCAINVALFVNHSIGRYYFIAASAKQALTFKPESACA